MNDTIKLILSLSLSGSILAVLLFAVKALIRHRIPKTVQYYLWIVVLLRFLLPFSYEGSVMNGLFNSSHALPQEMSEGTAGIDENNNASPIEVIVLPVTDDASDKAVPAEKASMAIDLAGLFSRFAVYVWLIGAVTAFAVYLFGYARFVKTLEAGNKPATDAEKNILDSLVSSLNGKQSHNIRLTRNRFIASPMLTGVVRPCIIIPDVNLSDEQLINILRHEITHYRHFDIVIKWLTMAASALHWFNPLIYVIKKEINHACELACDEAVIRNLNTREKQSYGETLISLAAETEYPAGVLQATMCEEKRTLKDRLTAIMKHGKISAGLIVISAAVLVLAAAGAIYLGAGVGSAEKTPPNIYIGTETGKMKTALTGTYSWSYGNTHIQADSSHPTSFEYGIENTVSVSGGQKLFLGTQRINADKKYDFALENVEVYKDGNLVEPPTAGPISMNSGWYLMTPNDAGEYIYCISLNFKNRGIVSYGFVVRVDLPTYDLNEIVKFRTPYIGDSSKVNGLVGNLPVPDPIFMHQYISLKTDSKPYGLTSYYEPSDSTSYLGDWPLKPSEGFMSILEKNALVLFSMIDNVDEVTFAFRNTQSTGRLDESEYDVSYSFDRASIYKKYGDLTSFSKNLQLLQDALEGRTQSAFKGLELYVWKNSGLTGNDDVYYTLLMGTNRNKTESEIYDLNAATSDLNAVKKVLSKYRSDSWLFVFHSRDIDTDTLQKIADELSKLFPYGKVSIGEMERAAGS